MIPSLSWIGKLYQRIVAEHGRRWVIRQFFAIAQKIDDSLPPIIDCLKEVDPSFREVPHLADPRSATAFVSGSTRYKVEFLTPNRGGDEYAGKPARMPALGGASAEPLRFLDFLIRAPVRSVLLHGPGVSVVVPAPERYAIHKLIVANRRREGDRSKIEKDLTQAQALFQALCERHAVALAETWQEAWERGPSWREEMTRGLDAIGKETSAMLDDAVARGAKLRRRDPAKFWPSG